MTTHKVVNRFRLMSALSLLLIIVLMGMVSAPAASAAQATAAVTMAATMANTMTASAGGACGAPGIATPAATELTAVTTGDIKIGVAISLSGAAKAYGELQRKGLLLAASEINAAGGIDGKTIALVIRDTASDKGQATTVFQDMINKDQVVAILGPTLSAEASAADPEAQKAGTPVIGMSNTGTGITEIGDYVFRVSLSEADAIPNTIRVAKEKLNIKTVAVMYAQNDKFSSDAYNVFKKELDSNGIQILDTENFNTQDADFSAQLTKIQGLNPAPDAIIVSSLLGPAAKIIVKARELGINTQIIGGNGFNTPLIIRLTGKASEGTIIGGAYDCSNADPVNQTFVKAYSAKYGDAPDQFVAQAYSALKVLADAIHRAKSITDRKAIRDALAATKDLPTPLGSFAFTEGRNAKQPTYVITIKDGKFSVVK